MLRRRHNVVLRNRRLWGGLVSRQTRSQRLVQYENVRLYSTAEETITEQNSAPPPIEGAKGEPGPAQPAASQSEVVPPGRVIIRTIGVKDKSEANIGTFAKDRFSPAYRLRKQILSNWVNKDRGSSNPNEKSDGNGTREKEKKGTFRVWTDKQVDKQINGTPQTSIKNFRKARTQSGPIGLRQLSFDDDLGKFTAKGQDALLTSKGGEQRTELFGQILGQYKQNKAPVLIWQPENIEGLDRGAELADRVAKASIPIDQSLRQKLLTRYTDVPIEEPDEELDVKGIAQAFADLKTSEGEYFASMNEVTKVLPKLPPQVAEQIRSARKVGLQAKVKITEDVLNSLGESDWESFLKSISRDSMTAGLDLILKTLETGPVKITRLIAEPILLSMGLGGRVDDVERVMKFCRKENINVSAAHLLRAYRLQCRIRPEKSEQLARIVPQLARDGFDERAYAVLMQIYGDARRRDLVIALFNNYENFVFVRPLRTTFIHNALLQIFSQSGMAEEAEYVFQAMKYRRDGAPAPDFETYGHIAAVYEKRPDYYQKLILLANEYLGTGLPFSPTLFGALMKACASAGRLDATTLIFDKLFSRPDLRPTKDLVLDYLNALMLARVDPSDEETVSVGLPMFERLPIDTRDVGTKEKGTVAPERPDEDENTVPADLDAAEGSVKPEALSTDNQKFRIPAAPVPPRTAGELLALADLQYQHLRKYQPQLGSRMNQRMFIRLFVSHGFYETFKKAYRWLALATGLRGRQSIFPEYQRKTKVSFADFAKGVNLDRPINLDERYEFDYLHHPLSLVDAFPALRVAYETRDIEFARAVINDYDSFLKTDSDGVARSQAVKDGWALRAEAMIINILAACEDMGGAMRRFDQSMETIVWNIDRPRLFAKRIAVFTGMLVRMGDEDKARHVFRRLQEIEAKMQSLSITTYDRATDAFQI
ncbi:hypothetical protein H072_10668 [Dactylellina haptotyla CBS 200.50]|uniref:Pentacotripeptide-repeat region of PRORP domain-containing protein n=1 Tax=Dactylellina haptotyla (strain CBS 200.50) TaxID=1284197 RepID=S8A456_DACHA|nr:hypothetical protein H072_10668 [Dactylellina haptotyla CBS 200.50]